MKTLPRAGVVGLAAGLTVLGVLTGPASARQEGFSVNTTAVITGGGTALRVTGDYDCPGSGQANIVIYAGLTRTEKTVPCTGGYPASWWVLAAAPAGTWQPGQVGFYVTFTSSGSQSQETGTLTVA